MSCCDHEEQKRDHEKDLAKINAKKDEFVASPIWNTVKSIVCDTIEGICIIGAILLVTQCACECMWDPKNNESLGIKHTLEELGRAAAGGRN